LLKEIVNNTFKNYSEERKNEVCEFLKDQEIKEKYEDEIDTFLSSLLVVSKLYDEIPNLTLMYDKNIKTTPIRIQASFTRDQMQSLTEMGINIVDRMLYTMYNELIIEIKKEIIQTENLISVDRDFLTINLIDADTFNPKLLMFANCKVLSIKDLRKMKLDKIDEI